MFQSAKCHSRGLQAAATPWLKIKTERSMLLKSKSCGFAPIFDHSVPYLFLNIQIFEVVLYCGNQKERFIKRVLFSMCLLSTVTPPPISLIFKIN